MKNFKLWLEAKKMVLWDDETKQPVHPDEAKNHFELGKSALYHMRGSKHGFKDGDHIHKDEYDKHVKASRENIKNQENVRKQQQVQDYNNKTKNMMDHEGFKQTLADIEKVPLEQLDDTWWKAHKADAEHAAKLVLTSHPKFSGILKQIDAEDYPINIQVKPKLNPIAWKNLIKLLYLADILNDQDGIYTQYVDDVSQTIEIGDPYNV